MTDIEKIREYLVGMANAACCNKQTAKDIKEIIIPHIDSLQKEPVSEDLEKAAINYMKTENPPIWGLHDGFIAGANWQKQQMMEKAVLETEVMRDSDGDGVETPVESWLTLENTEIPELPESLGLEEGDKVKILIVKSE